MALVQKFGGIAACKDEGNDLVIVVSAMGHTDELTAKARTCISSNPPQGNGHAAGHR